MKSVFAPDRLRELREQSNLTQRQLAVQAGVAEKTISSLEQGVRGNPQMDTLLALADVLGVSIEAFVEPEEATHAS